MAFLPTSYNTAHKSHNPFPSTTSPNNIKGCQQIFSMQNEFFTKPHVKQTITSKQITTTKKTKTTRTTLSKSLTWFLPQPVDSQSHNLHHHSQTQKWNSNSNSNPHHFPKPHFLPIPSNAPRIVSYTQRSHTPYETNIAPRIQQPTPSTAQPASPPRSAPTPPTRPQ